MITDIIFYRLRKSKYIHCIVYCSNGDQLYSIGLNKNAALNNALVPYGRARNE